MSTVTAPPAGGTPDPDETPPTTWAARVTRHLDAAGIVTPIITAILAFLIGGLVVLATGEDPISTYRAIFEGTGLQWLFPWVTGDDRSLAAINLQQTLLLTCPLILTGLAVALAFRAGLFNIGGQGQYIAGSAAAVWVASSWTGMPGLPHILLAIAAAMAGGAVWGGIAGLLRATTGANEVITTIMLNWIAVWVGVYLFAIGGPLQNETDRDLPVSPDIAANTHLPVFWGDPELQGLHIGIFVALLSAVLFWLLMRRSARGYEARAVGLNPEAARYGGIHVGRTYVWVMALCGLLAGLAGSLDILGWQFRLATNDIQTSQIGYLGIAVALLGRNTAAGTCIGALLFGALLQGTSVRNLDPEIFRPDLADNLTRIIQGLIILFVAADFLVAWFWQRRRGRRMARSEAQAGGAA